MTPGAGDFLRSVEELHALGYRFFGFGLYGDGQWRGSAVTFTPSTATYWQTAAGASPSEVIERLLAWARAEPKMRAKATVPHRPQPTVEDDGIL